MALPLLGGQLVSVPTRTAAFSRRELDRTLISHHLYIYKN